MKFIHTAFLLFFTAAFLDAQTIQVAPVQSNPVLKSFVAKAGLENANTVQKLTGHFPPENIGADRANGCPPELEGFYVTSGQSIEIKFDTFGITHGEDPAIVSIENAASLQLGSVQFDTGELVITYAANPGFQGAGTEVIQVRLFQPTLDTLLSFTVFVRRPNRVVVTETQDVSPGSISTFCLENELDFLKPKACSRAFDGLDNYDGTGFPVFYMSSYDYPDTCLVYQASRFPGVDTVNIRICDEWGVCDIFKVPYQVSGDTLSLLNGPFFDDFSSYDGPYPTTDLWLDNSVFLNNTLAKDPPSVGFVTFDGLDRRGDVYNIVNGIGDRLTSKPIDLSGLSASDNVSLRFYIAPKGYGLEPYITDTMTVEFRNNQREWVTMATYYGMDAVPIDSIPPFMFKGIAVNDPQFFHKAFQFRFSAVTSPGGSVDLWHVDYVYFDKGFFPDNKKFEDIAFTALPTSLLKNYTSLPWDHFKVAIDDEVTDAYTVHLFNHEDEPQDIENSSIKYFETTENNDLNQSFPIDNGGQNIPSRTPFTIQGIIPNDKFEAIKDSLKDVSDGDFRNLETIISLEFSAQEARFKFNDTIRLNTPLSNYFSHDDGTAEWQLSIQSAAGGEQFAQKYHANVDDTLKAVQIMFPHVIGDVQDQVFNLKIWTQSLDSVPVYFRGLLQPFYPNNVYDTLQGFTTYVLDNLAGDLTPVPIPIGDFYVGFEQNSAAAFSIPIGFDVQNDCQCNYRNTGNGWSKLGAYYKGAMMIRPVFGNIKATSNASEIPAIDKKIGIYPNPTTGLLNFVLPAGNYHEFKVSVINNLGQVVLAQQQTNPQLDLSMLSNGLYFVRLQNEKTGETITNRIILAKD